MQSPSSRDFASLFSSLKENRVTIPINEDPHFVQSGSSEESIKMTSSKAAYDSLPSLMASLLEMRKTKVQDCVFQETKCPPSTPTVADEPTRTKPPAKQHGVQSLYEIVLKIMDPKIELLGPADLQVQVMSFKEQLASSLDNEKQFFKKLGFSRKRTLKLADFKSLIMDTKNTITTEILLYLCNLAKLNIIVINKKTLDRDDYTPNESTSANLWLHQDDNENLYVIDDLQSETDATKQNNILWETYIKTFQLGAISEAALNKQKVTLLRHLMKYLKIDGKLSGKEQMVESIFKHYDACHTTST